MNNETLHKVKYQELFREKRKRWLISGVAGFIGSNLLEVLLDNNQYVVGLDNFITGKKENLELVKRAVGKNWCNFQFIEGDIRDQITCERAVKDIDFVLHQAALGSVPRSINDPLATYQNNCVGYLNILNAIKNSPVDRIIYASSSSVYGDNPELPKVESAIGNPMSPYALTKLNNEQLAAVFGKIYGLRSVGLRYFNVFGRRQDPVGQYAAVIPKWIDCFLNNHDITINGNGEFSRDFSYIENIVEANIRAAFGAPHTLSSVYNVACGQSTSLNKLISTLQRIFVNYGVSAPRIQFAANRQGDVPHSLADCSKIKRELLYQGSVGLKEGLEETINWYLSNRF